MAKSIKYIFAAAFLIGVAIFMTQESQSNSSPWHDVRSAATEALDLLASDDYVALLKNAVPPETLEKMTRRKSLAEVADQFRERKATRLRNLLEAAQDVEATLDEAGTTATFDFQRDVSGKKSILFTKIKGRWYVASKARSRGTSLGSLAPSFLVETNDGRQINSDDLRGRIVVLHFWATWCGPCVRQIPEHIDSLARYDNKDVEVIFVCMNGDQDGIAETIGDYSIPYSNVLGPSGWSGYGADVLPMSVVIDHEGLVASKSIEDIPHLLGMAE